MSKLRKLNSVETAKLYNFLQNNIDLARTASADEITKRASEALGFAIVPQNVHHLRKQMGLNPRPGRQASGKVDVEKAIVLIARELCGLKTGLGSVSSAELTALASLE
jgi:hypothetical protein